MKELELNWDQVLFRMWIKWKELDDLKVKEPEIVWMSLELSEESRVQLEAWQKWNDMMREYISGKLCCNELMIPNKYVSEMDKPLR